MRPADTSPEAWEAQMAALRRMTPDTDLLADIRAEQVNRLVALLGAD